MADSITVIKKKITDAFMSHPDLRNIYGVQTGDEFARVFSAVSLENILADLSAIIGNDMQQLIDSHVEEVLAMVYNQKAHTTRWYQQKALAFMIDMLLVTETDYYDTTGMSDAEIADAKIVKYCAVLTSLDSVEVTIKIAGENGTVKEPISPEALIQFETYFTQVKDAGVRLRFVNEAAELLDFEADIYYDPILLPGQVKTYCLSAAEAYINNLPFNGEFSKMALTDALQAVSGAKVIEMKWARANNSLGAEIAYIDAIYTPYSGYFNIGNVTLNMIPYVF